MKKLLFILIVFCLLVSNVFAVNIYQEGKCTYFSDLHFSIASSLFHDSELKLGGVFSKRLTNNLDVGFVLDYSHYSRKLVQVYNPNYYYLPFGFQGESIGFGPVIGYTKSIGQKGFGMRSTLGLRFTLSNVVFDGEPGKMAMAGFGSDFTLNFFKKFKLLKSLSIYPGLSLFVSINRTTGRNYDSYLLNHKYGNLAPDFTFITKATHTAYGLMAEIPISIKIFKNKYLIVKPRYYMNFKNNGYGIGAATSITFNLCF